ncbi:paraquat-inducible protein A [Moritella sp. 24]|uniref:paraquat-inducible protein A n=1 Tax=Moritella sp. 24 TaxID=2746230 RepID=UPI001BA8CC37|nr:paraquat-inducible protein A [Moritella sp. 24]QUM76489.1 paraquat-inducible protein A [Moritella sp. 24]
MSNISVCNKCDLIVDHIAIAKNKHAHCPRCNSLLYTNTLFSISTILALSITGLILVVIANVFPMFTITMLGVEDSATLIQGAWVLFQKKFYFVGLLVIFCSFIAPFLFLSCLAQVCLLLLTKRNTPQLILLLKLVNFFTEWSMLEVYLVSFLIAVFKLSDIADIEFQLGLLSFVSLMFISSLIMYGLNLELFWQKMEKNAKRER